MGEEERREKNKTKNEMKKQEKGQGERTRGRKRRRRRRKGRRAKGVWHLSAKVQWALFLQITRGVSLSSCNEEALLCQSHHYPLTKLGQKLSNFSPHYSP